MAAEFLTGLGIFKSMMDMAKALKDMNVTAVRNVAVIELQEKILAAQEHQATLVEAVRNLEAEIAQFETWATEKQRYELTDFGGGTFAYLLKPNMEESEPPHRICASCYQQGHKSILQFQYETTNRQDRFTCPNCKIDFVFGERRAAPTIRPGGTGMP